MKNPLDNPDTKSVEHLLKPKGTQLYFSLIYERGTSLFAVQITGTTRRESARDILFQGTEETGRWIWDKLTK